MNLLPLPAELLSEWWPVVSTYAAQMERRFPDDWPVAETLRQASNGTLVLWLVWDQDSHEHFGAIGTHIHVKPSGRKLLSLSWAAGRQHGKWARMAADTLEAYGRKEGCSRAVIEGRAGWSRALQGYDPQRWAVLTKEL